MQVIRYNETTGAYTAVAFTAVSWSNMQTRLDSTALPNSSILVYIKKAGISPAVAGTGTFNAVDDTNVKGLREYKPAAGELPVGISTLVFFESTGTLMERREVPVMVVYDDPYRPVYYGTVVAGTLTTAAVSTDRTETTANSFSNAFFEWLTGPNAGTTMPIGSFSGTGTVGTFTWKATYITPATPTVGDKFRIVTR